MFEYIQNQSNYINSLVPIIHALLILGLNVVECQISEIFKDNKQMKVAKLMISNVSDGSSLSF